MTTPRKSFPMYFPRSFSLPTAVLAGRFVVCAYDMYAQWVAQGSPTNPTRFVWKPKGPTAKYGAPIWGTATELGTKSPEPFGFVAMQANGAAWLAFRGSETRPDFYEDAWISQVPYPAPSGVSLDFGLVHQGFMDIYGTLRASMLAQVTTIASNAKSLVVTGHSLGCGLSTLAIPDVFVSSPLGRGKVPFAHYNLASPRVGDPQFFAGYARLMVPTFRVVNTEDVVPDGPTAISESATSYYYYKHIGLPVDFTAFYDSVDGNHDYRDAYLYALEHPFNPEGPMTSRLVAMRKNAGKKSVVERAARTHLAGAQARVKKRAPKTERAGRARKR
jgi:hypothetical protein